MNKKISTVFFGTHNFAADILQALIHDSSISVELVITRPDKPFGRKKETIFNPVKKLALKHNLKLDQPPRLTDYSLSIADYQINIVAQYGKIIPKHIIDAPNHGTLNVHTSLLPKYRGASPIQSALINGDKETGVTIMLMDEGLDTGPILLQKKTEIDKHETYLELEKRLARLGAEVLIKAVPKYISGEIKAIEQNDSEASDCKQLTRDDGRIDWNKTAANIYNLYRGLNPWPGIWTTLNGKRLKLLKIKPTEEKINPGQIMEKDGIMLIGTKDTSIEVLELQLEGKKPAAADIFLQGYKFKSQGVI